MLWVDPFSRPKGPSPSSLIWLRAKTNAKPQEPSNPAPSSNSNLRVDPFPRVSGQQVVAALERLGFRVRRQHGSHIIMRRDNPFAQTVVPAHRELDRGTLRAILRQTDIGVEDFIRLL
jgi:predicted RNA binding protein YcfA (HicA-like mRNA interferase family)